MRLEQIISEEICCKSKVEPIFMTLTASSPKKLPAQLK